MTKKGNLKNELSLCTSIKSDVRLLEQISAIKLIQVSHYVHVFSFNLHIL